MSSTGKEITVQERRALEAKSAIKTLRDLLDKSREQIATALPRHMRADRMARIVMTEVQKNPGLLECHAPSIIGCVIQASQLGLEIGVQGQAYLVPFKNKEKNRTDAQLIVGWRGLVDLARRSGQIRTFEAHIVHKNDVFEYVIGSESKLVHKPELDGDPGPVRLAYAMASFKDGGYQVEVMPLRELERIRALSKMADGPAWKGHTEEMYRKTVVRRICKFLPISIELQDTLDQEDAVERGTVIDVTPGAPTTTPSDDLVTDALEDAADALASRPADVPAGVDPKTGEDLSEPGPDEDGAEREPDTAPPGECKSNHGPARAVLAPGDVTTCDDCGKRVKMSTDGSFVAAVSAAPAPAPGPTRAAGGPEGVQGVIDAAAAPKPAGRGPRRTVTE